MKNKKAISPQLIARTREMVLRRNGVDISEPQAIWLIKRLMKDARLKSGFKPATLKTPGTSGLSLATATASGQEEGGN